MAGMADRFAKALQETEAARDPAPLLALFSDDCELSNLALTERGADGARRFWDTYLAQFDAIRSEFSHLIEADGQAALVWTSEGALRGGHPIRYRGVSILETQGDRVCRFETVYDSAAFVRPEAGAETRS